MSLVFAGVCSHAPGITGRAHLADPAVKDAFHAAFHGMSHVRVRYTVHCRTGSLENQIARA